MKKLNHHLGMNAMQGMPFMPGILKDGYPPSYGHGSQDVFSVGS